MDKFKAIVTIYAKGEDRVSGNLTLEEAVRKVVGNIYGYDDNLGDVSSAILERCEEKFGATFFCSMYTGQVSIKLEKDNG